MVRNIERKLIVLSCIVSVIAASFVFFVANRTLTLISRSGGAEDAAGLLRHARIGIAAMLIVAVVARALIAGFLLMKITEPIRRMDVELNSEISNLRFRDEMNAEVVESQKVGTMVTDAKTAEILLVNKMALDLFDVKKDKKDLNVMDFRSKFSEEGDKEFISCLMELRNGKGEVEFEQSVYPDDETCIHILVNAKKIALSNDMNVIIYSFMNITDRKRLEEDLLILSETDYLTAICNRRSGEYRTEQILKNGGLGMFCLFDVDKFKSVNDNYGHTVGDNVLIGIAETMKKTFRSSDVLVRLGGDEFVVFADGIADRETGEKLVRRFLENIDSMEVEGLGDRKISVSLGVLMVPEPLSFEVMYSRADSLMYDCKARPGNSYAFYA